MKAIISTILASLMLLFSLPSQASDFGEMWLQYTGCFNGVQKFRAVSEFDDYYDIGTHDFVAYETSPGGGFVTSSITFAFGQGNNWIQGVPIELYNRYLEARGHWVSGGNIELRLNGGYVPLLSCSCTPPPGPGWHIQGVGGTLNSVDNPLIKGALYKMPQSDVIVDRLSGTTRAIRAEDLVRMEEH